MIQKHTEEKSNSMKRETYDLQVKPDQALQLYRLEIPLEPGAWQLEADIRYERRRKMQISPDNGSDIEINVVDLGLEDEKGRSIGWSGSERTSIHVSENAAAPGYRPTRLNGGLWKLQLGFYKVSDEGLSMTVEIRQRLPERRWMTGETHSHSFHSDGRLDAEGIRAAAKSADLDFIWLTDHNTMSGVSGLVSDADLLMLPGMELTWYGGHANVYGLADSGVNYFARTKEEVNRLLADLRKEGGVISLNHPFEPGMNWTYGLESGETPFDLIEIWNGPWQKANQDALLYWHRELSRGRRLIATGGSDTHRPEIFRTFGSPSLAVLADSPTQSGILEAMKQGRSNILMTPEHPLLRLRCGDYEMGNTVPREYKNREIEVEAVHVDPAADEILFYNESGPFLELKSQDLPQVRNWKQRVPLPEGSGFVFALLKRELPGYGSLPGTLTNPIFFQR